MLGKKSTTTNFRTRSVRLSFLANEQQPSKVDSPPSSQEQPADDDLVISSQQQSKRQSINEPTINEPINEQPNIPPKTDLKKRRSNAKATKTTTKRTSSKKQKQMEKEKEQELDEEMTSSQPEANSEQTTTMMIDNDNQEGTQFRNLDGAMHPVISTNNTTIESILSTPKQTKQQTPQHQQHQQSLKRTPLSEELDFVYNAPVDPFSPPASAQKKKRTATNANASKKFIKRSFKNNTEDQENSSSQISTIDTARAILMNVCVSKNPAMLALPPTPQKENQTFEQATSKVADFFNEIDNFQFKPKSKSKILNA